jgi:hypothetical protein
MTGIVFRKLQDRVLVGIVELKGRDLVCAQLQPNEFLGVSEATGSSDLTTVGGLRTCWTVSSSTIAAR